MLGCEGAGKSTLIGVLIYGLTSYMLKFSII